MAKSEEKLITIDELMLNLNDYLSKHYDNEGIDKIKNSIEEIKFGQDDGGKTLDIYYKHEWGAEILQKICPLYIRSARVIHLFKSMKA